eukprot:gene18360-24831_t
MTTSTAPLVDPFKAANEARAPRVAKYKCFLLQRQLAELSAQVEAAVIEGRHMLAWKHNSTWSEAAQLSEEDRTMLQSRHFSRLAEIVQRSCMAVLKAIIGHKWSFPFLAPVDTSRFLGYTKVVREPMDLGTLKARMDVSYYKDPKVFWYDLSLEVAVERYEKLVGSRLVEENARLMADEADVKLRRSELVQAAVDEAVDLQCGRLIALVDKLPKAQLEAAVSFIASRHPGLPTHRVEVQHQQAWADGESPPPSRKVQVNLGKYDALLLRQLQHLVATCTSDTATLLPLSHTTTATNEATLGPADITGDKTGDKTTAATDMGFNGGPGQGAGPAGGQGTPGPQIPSLLSSFEKPAFKFIVPPTTWASAAAEQAPAAGDKPTGLALGAAPSAAGEAGPAGATTATTATTAPKVPAAASTTPPLAATTATTATTAPTVPAAATTNPTPAATTHTITPPPAPTSQHRQQWVTSGTKAKRNIGNVLCPGVVTTASAKAGVCWPGFAVGAGARARARMCIDYDPSRVDDVPITSDMHMQMFGTESPMS